MIEIKYLKALPTKLTNENKNCFSLEGSDIYCDARENRYVYLSLVNHQASACFFMTLLLKEYNAKGTMIKESRYFIPNTYMVPQKIFTMEEPIPVERDCEGLDVYIVYAEFAKNVLFNDKICNGITREMLLSAKSKPTTIAPNLDTKVEAPFVASPAEPAPAPTPAPTPAPAPAAAETKEEAAPAVAEEVTEEAPAEKPVAQKPVAQPKPFVSKGRYLKQKGRFWFIPIIIAAILFVVIFIIVLNMQSALAQSL